MNINRSNYETYFLDFVEGKLSAEQEQVLTKFLKFNPDLEQELRTFNMLNVEGMKITFPQKDMLKRGFPGTTELVGEHNFEMYAIAYLENDLTESQRESFEMFLASGEQYQTGFEYYRKTLIQPETVTFPYKSKLKRRTLSRTVGIRMLLPVAAAASIALVLLLRSGPVDVMNQIASLPEVVVTSESTSPEPDTKRPPIQEKAASIRIIRNSSSPVPVSNIKPTNVSRKESAGERSQIDPERKSLALQLPRARMIDPELESDRMVLTATPLPTINGSSLALADRIRYQVNRASELVDEDDVFIWNLASQGINEINRIAGTDMSLMASTDENGSVSGFRFKSKRINVQAPLSRDK